jgi:hypothetical protein
MPVTKLREWKAIAGNDLPNSDLAMPLRFNIHAAKLAKAETAEKAWSSRWNRSTSGYEK